MSLFIANIKKLVAATLFCIQIAQFKWDDGYIIALTGQASDKKVRQAVSCVRLLLPVLPDPGQVIFRWQLQQQQQQQHYNNRSSVSGRGR